MPRRSTHLLVDVASLGSPAKDLVVALDTVDRGLRVDGQVAERIELHETVLDQARLQCQRLVTPWKGQGLALTVIFKERADILQIVR